MITSVLNYHCIYATRVQTHVSHVHILSILYTVAQKILQFITFSLVLNHLGTNICFVYMTITVDVNSTPRVEVTPPHLYIPLLSCAHLLCDVETCSWFTFDIGWARQISFYCTFETQV